MQRSDIHLRYMEIVVTTRCTLNCKDCANLISSYNEPYQVEIESIIQSMDRILQVVEDVEVVGVLGGEPFTYPYLETVVNHLCSNEKIKKVRIVTNGTIVPKDKHLLAALKNSKVHVQVNDYPIGEKSKANDICSIFDENKIQFMYVDRKQQKWTRYGEPVIKDKNETDLEKQFNNCDMKCRSLLNGKLFYCPRSSHGNDLKIINESSYIDFLDNSFSKDELQRKLQYFLYDLKYIEACKMCNAGTVAFEEIDAAIQLK